MDDSPDGTEYRVTTEMLERLKARDRRFSDIDTAIRLDEELRDSAAIQILFAAIGAERENARSELESVDPTDFNKIRMLQAKTYRAKFIIETLEDIRRKGRQSAAELEAEGPIDLRDIDG